MAASTSWRSREDELYRPFLLDPLKLASALDARPERSADDVAQQLLDAALGDGEPRDDIAIVVVRIPASPAAPATAGLVETRSGA